MAATDDLARIDAVQHGGIRVIRLSSTGVTGHDRAAAIVTHASAGSLEHRASLVGRHPRRGDDRANALGGLRSGLATVTQTPVQRQGVP